MLSVQISPSRKVYVSFIDDTHPNKGGYYCEVFADEQASMKLDEFTISKNQIGLVEDRRKRAMVIANFRVKEMFKR